MKYRARDSSPTVNAEKYNRLRFDTILDTSNVSKRLFITPALLTRIDFSIYQTKGHKKHSVFILLKDNILQIRLIFISP